MMIELFFWGGGGRFASNGFYIHMPQILKLYFSFSPIPYQEVVIRGSL